MYGCFGGYDLNQIDIAPTIAEIFRIPFKADGKAFKEIVEYAKNSNKIIMLIIDSFGYLSYLKSRKIFQNISKMNFDGRLFRCKSNSDKTTPAIASILCGRKPEIHRIYQTGDVYKSYLKSILEVASEQGIKSSVIMEKEGALTFKGKVDIIKPIMDDKNIIKFDRDTKESTIEILKGDSRLIISHLRALDKLSYTYKAIKFVDNLVFEIYRICKINSLIILCGDHPPHESKECSVPLIVNKVI